MKIYHWRLIDNESEKYGNNPVVNEGVEPIGCGEIFMDRIFPNSNWDAIDRPLWKVQEFADKNYGKGKYTFEYYERELLWESTE